LIPLPPGTEMFQFPGFASPSKDGDDVALNHAGLPHSAIQGSPRVCRSPWLIAAYHGLPRLRVPRHPPHALARLTQRPAKQSTRDLLRVTKLQLSLVMIRYPTITTTIRCQTAQRVRSSSEPCTRKSKLGLDVETSDYRGRLSGGWCPSTRQIS
jgi:hypothetical protein